MGRIIKNNLGNFFVIFIILVLVFIGLVCYLSISTKGAETQEIKILPITYQGNWQNPGAALIQDLGPEADFEEFNEENSAYPLAKSLSQEEPIISEPEVPAEEESPLDTEDLTGQVATSSEEPVLEEVVPPIEEEISSPSEEEIIVPLIEENILSPSEPFEESLVSPSESLPILFNLIVTESFDELATESETIFEEVATESEPVDGLLGEFLEQTATKSEEIIVEEMIEEVVTESEEIIEEVMMPIIEKPQGLIEKTLEFSDFSVPPFFAKASEGEEELKIKNVQMRLSMAFEGGGAQDSLIIEYSYDDSWQLLAEYFLSDPNSNATNNGYWLYGLPIFESWEDLRDLRIRFKYYGTSGEIFLDAIWLEVEYGEREGEEEIEELTDKDAEIKLISKLKNFKLDEKPEFEFKYRRKKNIFEALTVGFIDLFRDEYKNINIKATVLGLNISPNIRYQGEGEFFVDLADFEKPRQFRPGTYVLKIEIEDNGQIYTQNQDFVWGVLAINTNKSIYLPGERAYLQMAALKDDGHTICDANLKLAITSPNSEVTSLNVQRSGKCGADNVTDVPDYFAYYQVRETGTYQMQLINLDNNYKISDSFEVQNYVPFDIERIGPTRIYPPADYQMTLRVKANQDFTGEVIEFLPDSFEIKSTIPDSRFQILDSRQILWQVDWKAGETHELKYTFDAPDISPYLYLLGPLQISDFQEARQWQVASDDATYGPFTFDADNDSDEDAWTFVSDMGTSQGLNPAGTTRAWSHELDETASTGVGPQCGQEGAAPPCSDGYVYTEMSSPGAAGDTFHMTFDTVLDASTDTWQIEFYWNQRGDSNLAVLTVQTNENAAGWVTRGTYAEGGPDVATSGTHVWNYESLDLTGVISDASTQLRFFVTTAGATAWHNDFGLDTITITGTTANAAPAAPTLHDIPFNNEKTGDSTPDFEFTGSDPDGTADIIYQIQVDDDYAFGSMLVNCESDTTCAAGAGSFTNTENGGDSSPFTEGQKIRFTPTTAMTTGTTYYSRVRAEDDSVSGGSGNYGSWSSIQSVTYVSGTSPSGWLQTTDEQFDTGTLTDTETDTGNDRVMITSDEDIVFIAATEAGTGSAAASLAINVPPGVSDDDFLLLFGVTADGDDGGFDALSGWTEIRDAAVFLTGGSAPSPPGMSVWWRIASSEPANYTITPTFGSTGISAQMLAFSGVDTTTPLDVTETIATGDSTNANPPTIGSGSSTDGYLTVIASFFDSTSITSIGIPSGYADPSGLGSVVGNGGGNGNSLGSAYRSTAIDPAAAEDPAAFTTNTEQWGAITVAIRPATGGSSGTIMSPEIDFDLVSGQDTWNEASFATTETNGDVKLKVYYTVSTACDTIVPDGTLSGNSSGFDVSASPIDISNLTPVATTYNKICLQATLTDSGGTPYLNDWTVTWTTTAGNTAPSFTVNPHEDPTSDDTTPTDMDANVTFKATATDPESDGWYLAVCKAAGISAGASGAAPTCDSGTWVISTASASSGVEITLNYTITASETNESYAWNAYACDDNSGGALCSAMSNGGTAGNNGTPFSVNHRPTFTAVSDEAGNPAASDLTITATTYNDTDTGGAQDTVSMYICKAADFTGSVCGSGGTWCSVTGVTPQATLACDLTVPDPQAHGEVAYYPYVVDSHGLAASGGKQGSSETFTVNDVVPTISGTPELNGAAAISLTAEKSTTDIYITGIVTDDNSCQDIVAANITTDVWQTTLVTRTGCDAGGEADSNKCYPDVTCSYDSATETCTGATDKTGGYKCTVSFQYYANPTDANTPWPSDDWTATLIPGDEQGENTGGEANSAAVEMNSFLALDLAAGYTSIAYGEVNPNTYTDPLLEKTRVEATGNCALDTNLSGTTMTGPGTAIPIANQRYASGSTAPAWSAGTALSGSAVELEVNVCKTNSGTTAYRKLWWGIDIDTGQAPGEYSGTNTIEAVKADWGSSGDWCE